MIQTCKRFPSSTCLFLSAIPSTVFMCNFLFSFSGKNEKRIKSKMIRLIKIITITLKINAIKYKFNNLGQAAQKKDSAFRIEGNLKHFPVKEKQEARENHLIAREELLLTE